MHELLDFGLKLVGFFFVFHFDVGSFMICIKRCGYDPFNEKNILIYNGFGFRFVKPWAGKFAWNFLSFGFFGVVTQNVSSF